MAVGSEYAEDKITDATGGLVCVNNSDMGVAAVDAWIKQERNGNGGVITPEFAMQVLCKTNHRGHLKTVVKNIKERCKTEEDVLPYRKFILSCVARREMGNAVLSDLRELADLACCRDEFEELNAEPKIFKATDCRWVCVRNFREFNKVKNKDQGIYTNYHKVVLDGCNFSEVKEYRFNSDELELINTRGLSGVLDLSGCDTIDLYNSRLDYVSEIKFKENSSIKLAFIKELPEKLIFPDGCDINFGCSYFGNVKELEFGYGCKVDFSGARELHGTIDVSKCDTFNFFNCVLDNVEVIKFRDKEQEKEFLSQNTLYNGSNKNPFGGKIIFADAEENVKNAPMNLGGMEM